MTIPVNVAGPPFAAPARVDLLALFETEYGADVLGATIVRVRGWAALRDPDLAAGEHVYARAVAFIGSQNDIARGSDNEDSPFATESAWKDYFFFEPFFLPDDTETAHLGVTAQRIIDVKSSRKLEELNQTLVMDVAGRNFAAAAASNAAFHADLSILLMLP